ncbi:hypothetical protein MRB53_016833 [Persea americana]|uniref:Uncharacterized protein n=1 Tax=Persea americana TaxID=3435 RepID=A0ACC2M493_PERAE|nr:hypothetical protein MRB53_016833 [Persea americana]
MITSSDGMTGEKQSITRGYDPIMVHVILIMAIITSHNIDGVGMEQWVASNQRLPPFTDSKASDDGA